METANSGRRRGRPLEISRDAVLDMAAMFDLRTLSVRALAKRLRISDAAIHYHFGSRDGLLRALVDRLTSAFTLPPPEENWRAWLRNFALSVRKALRMHPGAADYLVVGGPTGEHQLRIVETALQLLVSAGFDLERAWFIYAAVANHVVRQVQAEERADATAAVRDAPAARLAAEIAARHLPAAALVCAVVDRGLHERRDDMFAFALDSLIAGFGE